MKSATALKMLEKSSSNLSPASAALRSLAPLLLTKTSTIMTDSPILNEFNRVKELHPDIIALFRVGDYYESYCQDAEIVSDVAEIPLYKLHIEMAGFYHSKLDNVLPKLVRAGHRVGIFSLLPLSS